jgi:hypothetical protein
LISLYEYDDRKGDEFIGGHSYVQAIIARGLFSNWKQPVHLRLDKIVTKTFPEIQKTKCSVVFSVSCYGGGYYDIGKSCM